MALKLLHTADWHLGMRFPAFSEVDERKLRIARFDAVERILGEAEQHMVDAVLCAGDLFDEPQPPEDVWAGLRKLLIRRSWQRPLILLPGNHDPLVPGSPWEHGHPFRTGLPAFVHIVDRDDFTLALPTGAIVHAIPCRSQAGERDLALALPGREAGDTRLRIGLVHGQTFDMATCQTNFPIARDAGLRRGFDYLAIGDTHGFRDVAADSRVPVVYPGAPEPTNFGEVGAGCVAMVLLTRHGRRPLLESLPVSRWHWRVEEVRDLARLRSLAQEDGLEDTVLRLDLNLRMGLADSLEVENILKELQGTSVTHGRVGILDLRRDRLTLDVHDADLDQVLADLPPTLRRTAERLRAKEGTEEAEVARRALLHLVRLLREA